MSPVRAVIAVTDVPEKHLAATEAWLQGAASDADVELDHVEVLPSASRSFDRELLAHLTCPEDPDITLADNHTLDRVNGCLADRDHTGRTWSITILDD